jgi:hypothetical protein
MTMKKGRRDHYLPQSYLRGFIDPARQKEEQPLWHLDVRHQNWRMRSTKQVGYITGMYDYEGHHPELELVETADDAFLELENEFEAVRSWLIDRGFRNWHKKLNFLLRYMQMLRVRSPLYFDQVKAQSQSLRTMVVQEVHPDNRTLTVSDPVPLASPQIKNLTITNMREEMHNGPDWTWTFNWALRYTDSIANPFVANEQPFIAEGPTGNMVELVKHPDTLLVFPICWQACVFGSLQRFDKGTDLNGPEAMRIMRKKYRSYAGQFLVSPTKLDDITESEPVIPANAVGAD